MLRRLWSLVLVLIASSLVMSATVHACEVPAASTIECSGTVHSDDDADRSQGDADAAIPHHHGTCHGPSLDLPATDALSAMMPVAALRPFPVADRSTASHRIDPALRPPAA